MKQNEELNQYAVMQDGGEKNVEARGANRLEKA